MIYLNLQHLFAQKGITNPILYLHQNGFSRHTAHRLVHGRIEMLHFRHMERLCVLLNCSLVDLLAWQPDAHLSVPANHPLQEMKRGPIPTNITQDLQKLQPKELEEVRRFMEGLSQKKPKA